MKIGIDGRPLENSNRSGIGVYLLNLIKYINEKDTKNTFIIYTTKSLNYDLNLSDNFTIRVIPGKVGTLWVRYTLPKILLQDHINVFWGTEHILPRPSHCYREMLTVHDLALLKNPKWGSFKNALIQNIFTRISIKNADFILADSESTKNDIVKMLKVDPSKIKVDYLGVNTIEGIRKCNPNSSLTNIINKKYILYIGTIEPRKNITTCVKAFDNFCYRHNDYDFIIAGGKGWKYKPILKTIDNAKHRDKIKLLGYISDEEKNILYKNAEMFVFPSHYEGFGLPILEAMSYGIPVITSKNSSLTEVGGHEAYYLENENDYNELSSLMEMSLNLTTEEKLLLSKNEKENASKYTWQECGEKTLEALDTLEAMNYTSQEYEK